MRRILLPLTGAALAVLAMAGHTEAQVLTSSEVQAAMESRTPADHARLYLHFGALSARYTADADRHDAFARAAAGTPRGAGAAASHHERLAAIARESAQITNDLAVHHVTLAAGQPSTAPKGAEAFEAGAGAPDIPSEKRLLQLAARASRPSEHGQLREYYLMLARRAEADARAHRAMAGMYRVQSRANEPAAAQCEHLARLAADTAREARTLARDHE